MPPLLRLAPVLPVGLLVGALLAPAPSAAAQCGQVLVAQSASNEDGLASSFDVDGPWAVVAAPRDDQQWTDAGAAWVLREQDGAWQVDAKLLPTGVPSGSPYSHARVALHYPWLFAGSLWEPAPDGSGDRGVVRVYRHDPSDGDWDLEQRLWIAGAGPSTGFGAAVEFDEDRLFVSARERQELWVYRLDDDWEVQQVLTDPEPEVGGDWLGLTIAAEHGELATAGVRPGLGLVAYRFRGLAGGPTGEVFRLSERVLFEGQAVKAGRIALGVRDLAVQGFLTATGESSTVHLHHRLPDGGAEQVELVGPTGSTAEFGRALTFLGADDELLFVGARAYASAVGPLGLGRTLRRVPEGLRVESEFRAVPSYPQLRFATGARAIGDRLFVATQDEWGASGATSGRLYAFDLLAEPSLSADVTELSLSAGGSQELRLTACAENAGQAYLVAGSLSLLPIGNQLALGNHSLALQLDAWTQVTLDAPNQAPFVDTVGLLDGSGRATARIGVPPATDPALSGVELVHQAILFDLATGAVTGTTIPAELRLVP